jgi:hypothetical protein
LRAFLPLSTLYIRGVFFLLGGKLLPLQGDRFASINNPGWCPGLGASALSGRAVYIGASVLSGRAAIRPRKFLLHEFCVKFIKKMHGNVGDYKYFVTFALDYENMN